MDQKLIFCFLLVTGVPEKPSSPKSSPDAQPVNPKQKSAPGDGRGRAARLPAPLFRLTIRPAGARPNGGRDGSQTLSAYTADATRAESIPLDGKAPGTFPEYTRSRL